MALTAVSLAIHHPYADGTAAVTLHRLVQAAARARLAATHRSGATLEKAVARLAAAFPDTGYSDPRCWPRCERLLPHALALREAAKQAGLENAAVALMLDGAANYLHGRGAYDSAMPLLEEAIAIARKVLGAEHADVGLYLNNLANIHMNAARYDEAAPLYREAIEIGAKTLGRDNVRVATRINNLATLLTETGHYAEAEELFREAIETVKKSLGAKHQILGARLHNLAHLLVRTGRLKEAEELYREAIAIGAANNGRDNPSCRELDRPAGRRHARQRPPRRGRAALPRGDRDNGQIPGRDASGGEPGAGELCPSAARHGARRGGARRGCGRAHQPGTVVRARPPVHKARRRRPGRLTGRARAHRRGGRRPRPREGQRARARKASARSAAGSCTLTGVPITAARSVRPMFASRMALM